MGKAVEVARQLSKTYHKGQKYGKRDYFEYHIEGVVESLKTYLDDMWFIPKYREDEILIVAYLHDSLEDTKITEDVILESFGREVLFAVKAMTKGKGQSYDDYISHVVSNPTAKVVKYFDMLFNINATIEDAKDRAFTEKEYKRYSKYISSLPYFINI